MRVPNIFLEMFGKYSDFRLAVTFYSLLNQNTKMSKDGSCYIVIVKQETLSALSGMSLSTVKRSIHSLSACGFISFSIRTHKDNGELGTTMYYVKRYKTDTHYFSVQRKALMQIRSSRTYYIYCLCCKLACTACKSLKQTFFHSYNDLAELICRLGFCRKKSDIVNEIKQLVEEYKLLLKQRTVCAVGDYTENKYTITPFMTGKIKKAAKIKASEPLSKPTRSGMIKNHTKPNSSYIVHHFFAKVKRFLKKFLFFLANRGSP